MEFGKDNIWKCLGIFSEMEFTLILSKQTGREVLALKWSYFDIRRDQSRDHESMVHVWISILSQSRWTTFQRI